MSNPTPGVAPNPYTRRRDTDLAHLECGAKVVRADQERWGGYVYRPGQLVLNEAAVKRYGDELRRLKGRPDEVTNAELAKRRLSMRVWRFPSEVSIPEEVERRRGDSRELVVSPNHVLGSEPRTSWGGGDLPVPAGPVASVGKPGKTSTYTVGVLDTGVAADTELYHLDLYGRIRDPRGVDGLGRDDIDLLHEHNSFYLDSGAGHGTFVMGLLYRLLPELQIDAEPVLGTDGFGDDISAAIGLQDLKDASIVNMSFSGPMHPGIELPALGDAIRQKVNEGVVFVAAAGNHALGTPFFPAALDGVIAVGALDTTGPTPTPAAFSNFGSWIDVWAPGVDIHSHYVKGTWAGTSDGTVPDRTFDRFARWSGTSFAAPQVVAAILAYATAQKLSVKDAAEKFVAELAQTSNRQYLPPAHRSVVYPGP